MIILYAITALAVTISFIVDQQKTKKAFISGFKKLWMVTPQFTSILVVISIVLYFVPHDMIIRYLGNNNSYSGMIIASIFGSITVMPGPIVYPLCGILVSKGVSYSVIAAFSSSLMMVGILTYPVEKSFFGKKFAILRNIVSLIIALIIALIFKLVTGTLI